jgi:hypothetical protein
MHVMGSHTVLLNVRDQHMNNFDSSKHARLEHVHAHVARIKYFNISDF